MIMPLQQDTVPLWVDDHGDVRVAGTRILFDVLIDLHKQGTCPEEIAKSYLSLTLADVYGVLAYYHRHREEAEHYLSERDEEARRLREQVERQQGLLPAEVQSRLDAFRTQRSSGAEPAV